MITPFVKQTLRITAICLALAVLLLMRRPPQSGNAAITKVDEGFLDQKEALQTWVFLPIEKYVTKTDDVPSLGDEPKIEPPEKTVTEQTLEGAPAVEREKADRQQSVPTVGVVDARNCIGLNYQHPMQGSVSNRMVWNGHTFVAQKVCLIKEGTSVASIWSFEQRGKAILSETQEGSEFLPDAAGNPSAKPNP
jgi:hypothetical protein